MPTTSEKPLLHYKVDLREAIDILFYLGHKLYPYTQGRCLIQETDATDPKRALGNVITRLGGNTPPRWAQKILSKEPYLSRVVRISSPQQLRCPLITKDYNPKQVRFLN